MMAFLEDLVTLHWINLTKRGCSKKTMFAKKRIKKSYLLYFVFFFFYFFANLLFAKSFSLQQNHSLMHETLAKQLGWVQSTENNCGGYYLDPPFPVIDEKKKDTVKITSKQGILSEHSTSILSGEVTISRAGQQITANKVFLYRDPVTQKLHTIDMIGNVHLREPNTLIVGKRGYYNFLTKTKSLLEIFYRTSLNSHQPETTKISPAETQHERKITSLTAWGRAYEFSQTEPKIYELKQASYSTCPPIKPAWRVKAKHIVLNKNTGRGYATHARILVKNIPIFYTPYISFPLDRERKTGFLWPTYGGSNSSGPSVYVPFYWNLAPNYDTTLTAAVLTKRGVQLSDIFRYLTETSDGKVDISILPNDKNFSDFQKASAEKYASNTNTAIQSELRHLLQDSTTRNAFFWRDNSRFNEHWSSHVDFNYAGDDYYLQNFGSNLNEITQNQLLQEGDLYYKGQNWNFTGRVQSYQALHPIIENEAPIANQYRRLPQLIFNADYPDQFLGLEYFLNTEATHFEILKDPGSLIEKPIGNRLHLQPGFSLPLYWPFFYINPRLQLGLTAYDLNNTESTNTPVTIHRALPIFDITSGLSFSRKAALFHHAFQQTLEPQIYYTYIPYRDQADIPLFDTSLNTLTYNQLFNFNRFSGIDRIGDANQIGIGITTRFIDQQSGLEKIRLGIGEIIYFANRNVTLCTSPSACTDYTGNPENHRRLSPLSGLLNYSVNPYWNFTANAIWNPISKQLDNSIFSLHYQPDEKRLINLGFRYAHNGDILTGLDANTAKNNLKLLDFSFAWPLVHDLSGVGLWSQDWNLNRLQNLLYGLQYDTCCWAVRMVGGRAFTGLDPTDNNKLVYNSTFYIQFSLKGLGDLGSGNPNGLLSTISGYNTQFGQERR